MWFVPVCPIGREAALAAVVDDDGMLVLIELARPRGIAERLSDEQLPVTADRAL